MSTLILALAILLGIAGIAFGLGLLALNLIEKRYPTQKGDWETFKSIYTDGFK